MNCSTKPLIIFEIANNHGGSLEHGLNIIDCIHAVTEGFDFDFAFKFQYRSKTYVHPRYRGKDDPPYVKRFESTRLSSSDYELMMDRVRSYGCQLICTPFDEHSVDVIERQGFDYIKIASCSFTDWPLLERIAKANMPVIASTAGATLDDIDRVVLFFENRDIPLSLMHCVGEYPAKPSRWQLNQIDVLKDRYPDKRIGLSSHAKCGVLDAEQIAIAKGASIFEIHVDVFGHLIPNTYSWTPEAIKGWLFCIKSATQVCGVVGKRHQSTEKEKADLRKFQRGVYALRDIQPGEALDESNICCAYPNVDGQLVANDMAKYTKYTASCLIAKGSVVVAGALEVSDTRPLVVEAINKVRELLIAANVKLPDGCDMELSHHYGLERFYEKGCAIFSVINREYCKKVIVILPGQENPWHGHKQKEETFLMIYGDAWFNVEKGAVVETQYPKYGQIIVIPRNSDHSFGGVSDKNGAVFEEISTTHYVNDSFYEDSDIMNNPNRKTRLKFRASWLERAVV